MANPDGNEFVETTTRVYLQREDSRQSTFERVFPMLIIVVIFSGLATVAITNSGGGPTTIQNNHRIEVTK